MSPASAANGATNTNTNTNTDANTNTNTNTNADTNTYIIRIEGGYWMWRCRLRYKWPSQRCRVMAAITSSRSRWTLQKQIQTFLERNTKANTCTDKHKHILESDMVCKIHWNRMPLRYWKYCINGTDVVGKLDVTRLMCELNTLVVIFLHDFGLQGKRLRWLAGVDGGRLQGSGASRGEQLCGRPSGWVPRTESHTSDIRQHYPTSHRQAQRRCLLGVKPEQTSLSWVELNSAVIFSVTLIYCCLLPENVEEQLWFKWTVLLILAEPSVNSTTMFGCLIHPCRAWACLA